jgi:uncharacterized protein YndB with AHSA1/START domain
MESPVIAIEKLLAAPRPIVWRALTDKEWMKEWYFDLIAFKAEKGFKFQFVGGPAPERQYVHICEITEVVPNEKLVHTWDYKGHKGSSTLSFELIEKGDATLLKLLHSGISSFPADNADFDISNFKKGWNHLINTALDSFVKTKKKA